MTPDEAKQHAWLNELPADERAEIERTWKLAALGREAEPDVSVVSEAWAIVQGRMDQEGSRPENQSVTVRRLRLVPRRSMIQWAAIAAVFVLALSYYTWSRPVRFEVNVGEIAEFVLADGSDVVLASGSALSFKRGFRGNTRSVSLNGEAYFDVVASEVPFIVETFNATIEVLGTQFNVRAWEGDVSPETAVLLEEGGRPIFITCIRPAFSASRAGPSLAFYLPARRSPLSLCRLM